MRPDEKICPQCAETVKRAAKVCRYCSYAFTERDDAVAAAREAALKGEMQKPCTGCAIPVPIGAETCRHCGYAFTKEELDRTQMQEVWTYGGIALFAVIIVVAFGFCSGNPGGTGKSEAEAAADRQKGLHCLSEWDGANRDFVRQVTGRLRDPGSFEHDSTRISPAREGYHFTIMTYRARNGFGGMNVDMATARIDPTSCLARNVTLNGD